MSDLLTISSVLVAKMGTQSMHITIPIEGKTRGENKTVDTSVLLDTGARGNLMNKSYAKQNKLLLYPLNTPTVAQKTAQVFACFWKIVLL